MKRKNKVVIFSIIIVITMAILACEISDGSVQGIFSDNDASYLNTYDGVEYTKIVKDDPRPMVFHVIKIKMQTSGVSFLVTPPDNPGSDKPLEARTTMEFAEDFGVQIAINGDAFYPWIDLRLLGYKPHSGDASGVYGYAASDGVIYSEDSNNQPTLFFHRSGVARFEIPPTNVFHAISGTERILIANQIPSNFQSKGPEPRTAIGLNNGGNQLIIVVVDGRQEGYSEGATLAEVASVMQNFGVRDAINLDGGGSTTLVIQNENGEYETINSPVHQGIAGNQRPVANHLGIYIK